MRHESKKERMWWWPGLLALVFSFPYDCRMGLDFKRLHGPLTKVGGTFQGEEAIQEHMIGHQKGLVLALGKDFGPYSASLSWK